MKQLAPTPALQGRQQNRNIGKPENRASLPQGRQMLHQASQPVAAAHHPASLHFRGGQGPAQFLQPLLIAGSQERKFRAGRAGQMALQDRTWQQLETPGFKNLHTLASAR